MGNIDAGRTFQRGTLLEDWDNGEVGAETTTEGKQYYIEEQMTRRSV